jgi:hypothetical protein
MQTDARGIDGPNIRVANDQNAIISFLFSVDDAHFQFTQDKGQPTDTSKNVS